MNKAVFLDRDGTINVEKNYLNKVSEFEYLDGAVSGLRLLQDVGYKLIVITNQSGIARGYYSEDTFLKLNQWMLKDLRGKGVYIAKVYYCPHHPEGKIAEYTCLCNCRKPKTGLFWQAQQELEIDMERSFAIGDKYRDLSICKESKVRGILLPYGEKQDIFDEVLAEEKQNVWKCKNILEAAKKIIAHEE